MTKRCAIYTRKSTEEGLDLDYNSLAAQRDACEAFIRSQKSEGWSVVKQAYDDGGFAGGSMNRPALTQLLGDVDAGRVDIIVVYKVDRLTRSLTDFAKIIERLEARSASFVSVTQQFNTTSSMGRLTLNVLLSFAQFEREVTAERIRDKIAASKKKGIWMGGSLPLGYEVKDRNLIVKEAEAQTVRTLFQLYDRFGTIQDVVDEAARLDLRSKVRTFKDGRQSGGGLFAYGQVHHLLRNPIYAGLIRHKDQTYPGRHVAIIDQALWNRVETRLDGRGQGKGRHSGASSLSLLTGLMVDDRGERMTPVHARKGNRRYRYYISQSLSGRRSDPDHGWRLPAEMIEGLVLNELATLLSDEPGFTRVLHCDNGHQSFTPSTLRSARALVSTLKGVDRRSVKNLMQDIIVRITLERHQVTIRIDMDALGAKVGLNPIATEDQTRQSHHDLIVPVRLRRRGIESKLILQSKETIPIQKDPKLIKLVVDAYQWFEQLRSGDRSSVKAIALADGIDESDVSRFLPLAFLAPDIVDTILSGRQPADLTAESLKRIRDLPLDWDVQRTKLRFAD